MSIFLQVSEKYHPLAMRWFLVSTHYRQQVNYTQRALDEASDRIYYLYQSMLDVGTELDAAGDAGMDTGVRIGGGGLSMRHARRR